MAIQTARSNRTYKDRRKERRRDDREELAQAATIAPVVPEQPTGDPNGIFGSIIKSNQPKLSDLQPTPQEKRLTDQAVRDASGIVKTPEVDLLSPQANQFVDPKTGQVTGTPQAGASRGQRADTVSTPQGYQGAQYDVQRTSGVQGFDAAAYDAAVASGDIDAALSMLQAQTADPSARATVQGQLEMLMQDFEEGTPPWASGAMRQATAVMQSRGLGASSMAGQAIVQSAMESATAIAAQDASTYAQFEMTNLNNRQETMVFKTQARLQGILSDQAAENASKQFNASSQNQVNQFLSTLQEEAKQYNATQINAMRQFNAASTNQARQFTSTARQEAERFNVTATNQMRQFNTSQENDIKKFNTTLIDSRDKFNAQNSMLIAQANAQWRQNLSTANTAAQNAANMQSAKDANALTAASLDNIWQNERDLYKYVWASSESKQDRAFNLALQKLKGEQGEGAAKAERKAQSKAGFGRFMSQVVGGIIGIF